MNLEDGFLHFINSDLFKELSRRTDSEGGKCRGYLARHRKGDLKEIAMIRILEQYGYTIKQSIEVIPPTQKRPCSHMTSLSCPVQP